MADTNAKRAENSSSHRQISLQKIREASSALEALYLKTPLVYSATFSRLSGAQVYLKLENLQETGSFKIRGATCKIAFSRETIGPHGVVAASAGNHAQGVALAAQRAGFPATIVMPQWASISKQEATKAYGGKVVLAGNDMSDAIGMALQLEKEGKTFIHPYDDPDIIRGQGTVGLEIFQDLPDPDFIIVPIGGGGLFSGIAEVARQLRPSVKMVGVQATACPSVREALRHGKPVQVEAQKSIADGISVKQLGAIPFEIIRACAHDVVLVDEGEISAAILMLLERRRVLAEGSGAASLAALLKNPLSVKPGSKVVLVVSGGNVDTPLVDRVIRQGLFRSGRILRFAVRLEDTPGALADLLKLVAFHSANVLDIYHDRGGKDLPLHLTRVELEVETRGAEHKAQLMKALEKAGHAVSTQ